MNRLNKFKSQGNTIILWNDHLEDGKRKGKCVGSGSANWLKKKREKEDCIEKEQYN